MSPAERAPFRWPATRHVSSVSPGAPSSSRRRLSTAISLRLLLVLLPALLCPPSAETQDFGQWWWDGTLGLGQRGLMNSLTGFDTTRIEERDLQLSLGLNGFLGHPALGDFRLGVDLFLSELRNGESLDRDSTGFSLDLNVLPRGAYPLRLFARRMRFDFSAPASPRPFSRLPDTTSVAGARLRIRRGTLRGTLVGVEHSSLDFVDPDLDNEIDERQYVDWGRQIGSIQNHMRLERSRRTFSFSEAEIDDLVLTLSQQGKLTDLWEWQLSGTGIQRDVEVAGRQAADSDDLRLRNVVSRPIGRRDQLQIQTTLALANAGGGASSSGYGTGLFYRVGLKPGLQLSPFVEYFRQSSELFDSRAPRAGLIFTWGRNGTVKTLLTTQGSYATLDRQRDGLVESENLLALSLAGTVSHGEPSGLLKELELELSHNDLRLSQEPIAELPDLGLAQTGLRSEDRTRLRLRLAHAWRRSQLSGWIEGSRREGTGQLQGSDFENETLSANLQASLGRVTVRGGAGATRLQQGALAEQEIRFDSLTLSWRPWRLLSLHASYRTDERILALVPDFGIDRWEAGLSFQLGQLVLRAEAFEQTESIDLGPERNYRGFRWTLTRRFSGWLPVITGLQRRGVIR